MHGTRSIRKLTIEEGKLRLHGIGCVNWIDTIEQKTCGRLYSAEPDTDTSTSPQQALAHPSFRPAGFKRCSLRTKEGGGRYEVSEVRLPGILWMDHLKQIKLQRLKACLLSPFGPLAIVPIAAGFAECRDTTFPHA